MKTKTRKQRFRDLQAMMDQGMNACVIELARDYLRDFDEDGAVWLGYGLALADFAKHKEAKEAFSHAIKHMRPEKRDLPCTLMGRLYEDQGKYRNAIAWYKKAIRLSPGEARNHIFMGNVLVKIGELAEAGNYFRQATKCKKGPTEEAYYNLGVLLAGETKYKSALNCFEKALRIDSEFPLAKQVIKDIERVLIIKKTSNQALQRRP